MNPFEWHWLTRTVLSLIFIVPAWLSIGFFDKTYQIRGEVSAAWFFFCTGLGIFLLSRVFNLIPTSEFLPGTYKILAMTGSGLLFGAATNALLFSAMASASRIGINPAIPQAIQGTSVIFVFVLSILLAYVFPKYFNPLSFNPMQFLGILLVAGGITLVVIYK